ncbi:MAG: response regulator transcription factor [Evtepia sp.]|jgi:DNA-binding LytR/AlgR family response regulator|nr:response regulator transcription factor [Evtepia sp.]
MLRIGICDDVYDQRLLLCAAIERILEARSIEHQVFEFSSGEGLISWLQKHSGELDLVFLDIEMNGLSGMETAKELRRGDDGLQLVFVTGYPDYVFDGYSVGALGYLIKPPKPQQLSDVLTRALAALHKLAPQFFICHSGEVTYRIPKKEILYFYSDRRQVVCVTPTRTYQFYGKLDEVAEAVGSPFVRIHQRYLIHAAAVERMETTEVVIASKALPISRSYQSAALLALTKAILE